MLVKFLRLVKDLLCGIKLNLIETHGSKLFTIFETKQVRVKIIEAKIWCLFISCLKHNTTQQLCLVIKQYFISNHPKKGRPVTYYVMQNWQFVRTLPLPLCNALLALMLKMKDFSGVFNLLANLLIFC